MNDSDLINQLTKECQASDESSSLKEDVIDRAQEQVLIKDLLTLITRSFCGPFRSLNKGSTKNTKREET